MTNSLLLVLSPCSCFCCSFATEAGPITVYPGVTWLAKWRRKLGPPWILPAYIKRLLSQWCKKYLIISWYLHVRNGVAVAAYSRLASRSQAKFYTKKLSPLVCPCAAAPAQSTTSAHRSLDFRRATFSPRGRWVGSWPLLLRSVHEDTS